LAPKRLSVAEKTLRGTLNVTRERAYSQGKRVPRKPARVPLAAVRTVSVPPPPASLSKVEREIGRELAAELGNVDPGKLSTFRLLVECTGRLRSPKTPSGSFAPLAGQCHKLRQALAPRVAQMSLPPLVSMPREISARDAPSNATIADDGDQLVRLDEHGEYLPFLPLRYVPGE
jgi:hypothetical protein